MFQVSNPLRFYSNNPNIDDTPETDGTYSAVPNLSESQQRLQRVNKITNYVIYGCAIFLLTILLLTVGITLWKSYQDRVIHVIPSDESDTERIRIIDEVTEKIITTLDDGTTIIETHKITEKIDLIVTDDKPHERDPNLCAECLDYNEIISLSKISSRDAEKYISGKVTESSTLDLDTRDDERISAMESFVDRMSVIPRALLKVNEFLKLNRTFNVDLSQAAGKTFHSVKY